MGRIAIPVKELSTASRANNHLTAGGQFVYSRVRSTGKRDGRTQPIHQVSYKSSALQARDPRVGLTPGNGGVGMLLNLCLMPDFHMVERRPGPEELCH